MSDQHDALRAEYLILQAMFEKSLDDWDHTLAETIWDYANKMFAKAFEAHDKADELFARNSKVGTQPWLDWVKATLEAEMYSEIARSFGQIIEQTPSIREYIK